MPSFANRPLGAFTALVGALTLAACQAPATAPVGAAAPLPAPAPVVAPAAAPTVGKYHLMGVGALPPYAVAPNFEIYDPRTQLVQIFPQTGGFGVRSASVDAAGNIAYADAMGRLHLFDPRTGEDYIVPAAGRNVDITNVALAGNGRQVMYTGFDGGTQSLYVADLATGRQFSMPYSQGFGGPATALSSTMDGSSVLIASPWGTGVVDLGTGVTENLPYLMGATDAAFLGGDPNHVVFSQGGRTMLYDRGTGMVDTMPIQNAAASVWDRSARSSW